MHVVFTGLCSFKFKFDSDMLYLSSARLQAAAHLTWLASLTSMPSTPS